MAKHVSLDFHVASQALAEQKLWAGGSKIDWVETGSERNGFPPAQKALAAVDVVRDGERLTLEDWRIQVYYHRGPNHQIPAKFSLGFLVGRDRVFGIDDGSGGPHKNPPDLEEPFDGKPVGFPHMHFPVKKAAKPDAYAEPIAVGEPDEYWTLFCSKINMTGSPPLVLPLIVPKQGDLLS